MNRNRIGLKLGAVIVVLFLVVLLTLGFVIDRLFSTFYHAKMREDVEELAAHFANMVKTHEDQSDEMIQTFAEFSNVSIYLVNQAGDRTANLGKLTGPDPSFIKKSDIDRLFKGNSVYFEFEAPEGARYFVSAKPILEGEHATSALYVLSSMQGMVESLERVRFLLILSGAGAFFLALGFTYIVSQVLSRPLVQMEQATRRIAKGDLETRLEVRSSDEIGTLAAGINDLAKDLQHYRDTRQEFFANVSHELRTPITYLEGYAKVLADELYDTEDERKQYLNIIIQESQRLNHLIHDLFELSKMEEGKISLSPEWVDLKELIDQSVNKVQLKVKEKGLSLQYKVSGEPSLAYIDGFRMEQVVLNLLENAIRYTEKGEIRVLLTGDRTGNRIEIEDTGIGIPEDELPYIFDRFYRVEKSRSRELGGTGLGLAIVKKLIELQGGSIQVTSKLGTGTRFIIKLPRQVPSEVGS